jgi:1-phosphatidylinositol phosphodiesterase
MTRWILRIYADLSSGIHPTSWPDSRPEGFEWTCAGKRIRVQDWYRVPTFLSIPEKLRRATHVLTPDGQSTGEKGHEALAIAFMSASAIPFALPPTIARGFGWPNLGMGVEGVNARLTRWCLRQLATDGEDEAYVDSEEWVETPRQPRLRGWVLLDFYDDPKKFLVPLMIEFNFKGRIAGEEGWSALPPPSYEPSSC